MTISIRGNAGAYVDTNTSQTLTATLPTHAAGDMLIVRAACKPYTATITCGTSGWQPCGDQYANGSTDNGNGVGSLAFRSFWKIATSASETNPTIDFGLTPSPGMAVAVVYQKTLNYWVDPVGAGGGDSTARTSQTCTISSHISTIAGDMVDFFLAWCDNYASTSPTFTQSGVTFGTVAEQPATAHSTSTGNDGAMDGGYRLASSGTSSAAAVVTATFGNSEQGGAWTTRLRESDIGPAQTVYPSALNSAEAFGSITVLYTKFPQTVEPTSISEPSVSIAADSFARTNGSNWGNADVGGAWGSYDWLAYALESGPSLGSWSVSNPYGQWTTGALSNVYFGDAWLDVGVADFEATLTMQYEDEWDYIGIGFRKGVQSDDDVCYVFFVEATPPDGVNATLRYFTSLTNELNIITEGGPTTPNSLAWKLRLRVEGTSIKARIWSVGDSEPGTWQLDLTDSNVTVSGKLGIAFMEGSTGSSFAFKVKDFLVVPLTGGAIPSPTITQGEPAGNKTISPTGLASAEAFGTATIARGGVVVVPTGIATAETSGTATILSTTTLAVSGISSAEAFGTAIIAKGGVTIAPSAIASAEAFGSLTVSAPAPGFTISPVGIAAPSGGAPAFVQTLGSVVTDANENTLVISPSGKTVAVGNTVFVSFGCYPAGIYVTAVSDNLGNTYSEVERTTGTNFRVSCLWAATVTTGGSITTITLTQNTNGAYRAGAAVEYSGVGSLVSDGNGQTGSGTPATWANSVTIPANGIVVGATTLMSNSTATAGSASGSPSTTISQRISTASSGWMDTAISDAIAGGSEVTGFSGTTAFTTDGSDDWGGASGIHTGSGGAPIGAPVLAKTAKITPAAIDSAEAFGTADVSTPASGLIILPSAIASAEAFGTATILCGNVNIVVSGIASAETFGTAVLKPSAAITVNAISSVEAFGTATINRGNVNIVVSGIDSSETFGNTYVSTAAGPLTITATAIASAEAFGTAVLTRGGVIVLPSGIASVEIFGTEIEVSTGETTIRPSSISTAEAFGTATILRGGVRILPTAIPSTEAVVSPAISASAKILPTAIASAQALGTPVLAVGGVAIQPSAIASTETFGNTYLDAGQMLFAPVGIASTEAFGTAVVRPGGRTVSVTGIATDQALGTPVLAKTSTISVTGIASAGAYGVPVVIRGAVSIVPQGATTGEALGTPTIVVGGGFVLPVPIGSGEAFGNATVSVGAVPTQTVEPTSIDTANVFGVANIRTGNINVIISGIGTAAVVPNPQLYSYWEVRPTSITTAELLGLPVVAKGPAYIRPSGIASEEVVPSAALANLLDSWRWVNNSLAMTGTRSGGWPVLQSGLYDTTRQEGEG